VKATFGALLSRTLFLVYIPAAGSSSGRCRGSMARLQCTCITSIHVSMDPGPKELYKWALQSSAAQLFL
jgi:hypothetical protein